MSRKAKQSLKHRQQLQQMRQQNHDQQQQIQTLHQQQWAGQHAQSVQIRKGPRMALPTGPAASWVAPRASAAQGAGMALATGPAAAWAAPTAAAAQDGWQTVSRGKTNAVLVIHCTEKMGPYRMRQLIKERDPQASSLVAWVDRVGDRFLLKTMPQHRVALEARMQHLRRMGFMVDLA
jgi:hypothetical protein